MIGKTLAGCLLKRVGTLSFMEPDLNIAFQFMADIGVFMFVHALSLLDWSVCVFGADVLVCFLKTFPP